MEFSQNRGGLGISGIYGDQEEMQKRVDRGDVEELPYGLFWLKTPSYINPQIRTTSKRVTSICKAHIRAA